MVIDWRQQLSSSRLAVTNSAGIECGKFGVCARAVNAVTASLSTSCHGARLEHLKRPVLCPADSSSLVLASHSRLCSFEALVDTALVSAEADLSSAASTSAGKTRNGE